MVRFCVSLVSLALVSSLPFLAGLAFSPPLFAQVVAVPCVADQFFSGTGVSASFAGSAVDLDGDRLLVGASSSAGGCASGSVFVREWNGVEWVVAQQLRPAAGEPGDGFGRAVALDGDLAVIGAPGCPNCSDLDAVHVFRRDPVTGVWIEEAQISAPGLVVGDRFGDAVAVTAGGGSDDVLVIGSPSLGADGAAHVYRFDPALSAWSLDATFAPVNPALFSQFGTAVAIDGDVLLVGGNQTPVGVADLYRYDPAGQTWSLELDLGGLVPNGNAFIGSDLAIEGDLALVSSRTGGSQSTGVVYAFDRDPLGVWSLSQEIVGSDVVGGSGFGSSLDLEGTTMVVTAPLVGRGFPFVEPGAYVFDRPTAQGAWVEIDKITDPDPSESSSSFLEAVAVSGSRVVVGEPQAGSLAFGTGLVWIFEPSVPGGVFDQNESLVHSLGASLDTFGYAIASSGNTAMVSALNDSDLRQQSGSVHVFSFDPQFQIAQFEQVIRPSDAVAREQFGTAIALVGNRAAIGARNDAGSASGSVYIFERATAQGAWSEVEKLVSSNPAPQDAFGGAIALGDDFVAVGIPGDSTVGENAGAVTIFRRDPVTTSWSEEQTLLPALSGGRFGTTLVLFEDQLWISQAPRSAGVLVEPESIARYTFDSVSQTWIELAPLAPAEIGSGFGASIALDGAICAVGAPTAVVAESPELRTGEVRIYVLDPVTGDPIEQQLLERLEGPGGREFGRTLALESGVLLAGARTENDVNEVLSFRSLPSIGEFVAEAWIESPVSTQLERFGHALAIVGDRAMISALRNSDACGVPCSSCGAGTAYVIDLTACSPFADCNVNGVADTLDILTGVSEDCAADGIPDECASPFVRGDTNRDGGVDTGDVIFGLSYLFEEGPSNCLKAHDANDDGAVDLGDPITTLAYLFSGGPSLPAPFPLCGSDPTPDCLTCDDGNCD